MHELELKFCVPTFTQATLSKQVATTTAKKQRLSAYYFDTPNNDLAKNGIALRVRYEDEQWVQTLKTNGDGVAKRVELNTILDMTQTPAKINVADLPQQLKLGDNQQLSEQLLKVMPLDKLADSLTVQYFTDIERTSRVIKKNNSKIEIAYDLGNVGKGKAKADKYPIHEIEFELIEGEDDTSVIDLVEIAKTWCKKYKLYLSTVTKAQRGGLLLAGQTFANPTKADLTALQLDKNTSQFVFLQQVVNNCLLQILPNASAIADGSPDGNHVHQIRVGIRRLRTALKVFKNFALVRDDTGEKSTIDQNWLLVLKQTFSLLGEYRDREILKIKTQPMLESVGSPHVEWSTDVPIMPIDAVRANDFQIVLLELIAFTHLPEPKGSEKHKAKPMLAKKLDKLFNSIARDSERFASLDTESQHDVRKNLKTLRYISEFAAPVFADASNKKNDSKKGKKAEKLNTFLQYLEPAQDVLGEYNDNVVGHAHYQEKAKTDPNALFAMGWFGGQEKASAEACAVSLKTVKNAPTFW